MFFLMTRHYNQPPIKSLTMPNNHLLLLPRSHLLIPRFHQKTTISIMLSLPLLQPMCALCQIICTILLLYQTLGHNHRTRLFFGENSSHLECCHPFGPTHCPRLNLKFPLRRHRFKFLFWKRIPPTHPIFKRNQVLIFSKSRQWATSDGPSAGESDRRGLNGDICVISKRF